MILYSELLLFFPPIYKIPGINLYNELNYSYGINNAIFPLKYPTNELYNIEILRQLYNAREDLYNSKSEEELKIKLIHLNLNWGELGLDILNNQSLYVINNIIKKINRKEEIIDELNEMAKKIYYNLKYNNSDINVKVDKLIKKIEKLPFLENFETIKNDKLIENFEKLQLLENFETIKNDKLIKLFELLDIDLNK